ncbi:hypothetical protein ACFWPV_15390 [Streptomyces uncialis]|uniref:hypothetical protein n=1 Tax=Streptomyces uncialis TaxID=1048205 RepID=UPI00364B9FDC
MSDQERTSDREEPSDRAEGDKPKVPLPRDPEDQQADGDHDDDPLTIPVPDGPEQDEETPGADASGPEPEDDPRDGRVHPEHPVPDEPTG